MPSSPASAPIRVRAPATSANLGPGFDCLGLALDLWNEVDAEPAEATRVTTTDGSAPPADADNLILRAARAVFDQVETPMPGMALRCTNRVPFSRGLGSSAAAIAAGVLLANRWLGEPLGSGTLVDLASRLEGHPDNVVPCLLGGVRAAVLDADRHVLQAPVQLGLALHAAIYVPDLHVPTEAARAALPSTVSLADALFNVGRVALLVAALSAGEAGALREATRDRLHQPHRAPLFPAGLRLVDAAVGAGALGAYVSGAGPTVLALCADAEHAREVACQLVAAAQREGVQGHARTLPITSAGAHIVDR